MPLESATYVNQLVDTNPATSDAVSQGDDHLRLIKLTLVNTLPNLGGAMTATQTQLNTAAAQAGGTQVNAPDGTVSAPGFAFTSELGTGFYRIGLHDVGLAIGGAKVVEYTATGVSITGTLAASSNATVGGTLGVTGNTTLSGTLGVTGNTTLSGTLATGSTTITGTLGVSSNATVGGTLGVTGVATFTATPVFSAGIGATTATTPSTADNSTNVATTAYVQNNLTTFAGAFGNEFAQFQEQQTAGTDGDAAGGNGVYATRTLNTSVSNGISGASINTTTHVITLPAGTYYAEIRAPLIGKVYNGDTIYTARSQLYNSTDAAELIGGPSECLPNTSGATAQLRGSVPGVFKGRFTLSGSKSVVLRSAWNATPAGAIGGSAINIGSTEIYTDVSIWKIG